jgi:AmmeMemoRadiSam system protein B
MQGFEGNFDLYPEGKFKMQTQQTVRPSPIAGRWYPGDANALAHEVDQYVQDAQLPELDGEVVAIMVPHAGHLYSGPVAGYAFRALRNCTPDLVAVVSPMHHPYPYPLLTSLHRAYWTPLGEIEIDREAVEKLNHILHDRLGFGLTPVGHDPEHSLEIELPFLQRVLKSPFQLLPVMVREQSQPVIQPLGTALAEVLEGHNALLVASTDLSHFYPQRVANQLDAEMLHQVETFNPEGVLRIEEEGRGFACGRGALAAVMWAAKAMHATQVVVLHHATSGDVTGDTSEVVGYGAAVMLKPVGG